MLLPYLGTDTLSQVNISLGVKSRCTNPAHRMGCLTYLLLLLLVPARLLFEVGHKVPHEGVLENLVRGNAAFWAETEHLGEEVAELSVTEP